MKILMVCLGNICRSPLAEGIMRSKLNEDFFVDSAGTGDWHVGQLPDKRSIAIAKSYGIDISMQRARQFQVEDFDIFDRIFVMDASNLKNVLVLAQTDEHRKKVRLILNEKDVPDPYYGGDEGFANVFRMLDEATDEFVKTLNLK